MVCIHSPGHFCCRTLLPNSFTNHWEVSAIHILDQAELFGGAPIELPLRSSASTATAGTDYGSRSRSTPPGGMIRDDYSPLGHGGSVITDM
jgi:hypothetical protein